MRIVATMSRQPLECHTHVPIDILKLFFSHTQVIEDLTLLKIIFFVLEIIYFNFIVNSKLFLPPTPSHTDY